MTQALVTGANRGLGLEFVRQLLGRGDRVIAACRQPGRAPELTRLAASHPGHLKVLPLALPDERSIAELAREVAALDLRIDLLINNAGMLVSGERFGEVTAKSLRESFAANCEGAFLLTQALAARLVAGAKVVNISTGLASIAGVRAFRTPSYAISKAALNMATRQLARALAGQRITVVAMSPGWVQTDMGGAGATLTPTESVQGLLRVIERLTPGEGGCFLGEDGAEIAW